MKLLWSSYAVEDLASIRDFIAKEDPAAAQTIAQRILNAAETIEAFPSIGRIGRVRDTREFVVTRTPFLIAYRVEGELVVILRILHGARRWPDI